MEDPLEEFYKLKYNTEKGLIDRGFVLDWEKTDTHITYKKNLLFRIYYDGDLTDENGYIDEISIFDIFGERLYNGNNPKSDEELDELLKKFQKQHI